MGEMKSITVYPMNGSPLRFEQTWGYEYDSWAGTITFSYREGGTFFATFDRAKLFGIDIEV